MINPFCRAITWPLLLISISYTNPLTFPDLLRSSYWLRSIFSSEDNNQSFWRSSRQRIRPWGFSSIKTTRSLRLWMLNVVQVESTTMQYYKGSCITAILQDAVLSSTRSLQHSSLQRRRFDLHSYDGDVNKEAVQASYVDAWIHGCVAKVPNFGL